MKKKILLLTAIPMLALSGCSCGGTVETSVKDLFASAVDLGATVGDEWLKKSIEGAAKDKTDYYKFELTSKYKFDIEELGCLTIAAFDNNEHYDYCSMKFDLELYDSSWNQIDMITLSDYVNTYSVDAGHFSGDTGIGVKCATKDAEPGTYYFSLTPLEEVDSGTYQLTISPTFAE